MTNSNENRPKRVTLRPGEFFVSNEDVVISTLLGSCIAACLYDPVQRVLGMNHFLLSEKKNHNGIPLCVTEAGRYGVYAMELLINAMLKLGARKAHLQAKVFGGGMVLPASSKKDSFLNVAAVNVRFIREFLKKDGIPLIAADLGGDKGRVIYFCSDDYSVYVRKIVKVAPGVIRRERELWKVLEESTTAKPDVWL